MAREVDDDPDVVGLIRASSGTGTVLGDACQRVSWAASLGLVVAYGIIAIAVSLLVFRTRDILA